MFRLVMALAFAFVLGQDKELLPANCPMPYKKSCELDLYFSSVAKELAQARSDECAGLVIYGAALGAKYLRLFSQRMLTDAVPANRLRADHGDCFFKFVLAQDVMNKPKEYGRVTYPSNKEIRNATFNQTLLYRRLRGQDVELDLLVALDAERMPYKGSSMRRNVKILKTMGHLFFPWARRFLWIDAKLRLGALDPLFIFEYALRPLTACTALIGLPFHNNTYGANFGSLTKPDFRLHAFGVLAQFQRGRNLTDSFTALNQQLEFYEKSTSSFDTLASYLVDTAMIARDFSTSRCRNLNTFLNCQWFQQIACFSDRDQFSLPFVLDKFFISNQRNISSYGRSSIVLVDREEGLPTIHILPPGRPPRHPYTESNAFGMRIHPDALPVNKALHWYYSHAFAIGKCFECVRRFAPIPPPSSATHGGAGAHRSPQHRGGKALGKIGKKKSLGKTARGSGSSSRDHQQQRHSSNRASNGQESVR